MRIKKISIIGNSCSGKTTVARQLAKVFSLPLHHSDSIQYLPGLKWREPSETRRILSEISQHEEWIIDGLGPLKILEERMQRADLVVVLRPSLPTLYWRFFKRQIKGLFLRREELPENCFEATPAHTIRMIKTIWNVHFGFWKQMDRILKTDDYRNKVISTKYIGEIQILVSAFCKEKLN